MLNVVCQETERRFEVTDDKVDCKTVLEDVCPPDNEEGRCRKVSKQVCELSKETSLKAGASAPAMECDAVPVKICGPEKCPIVKGDRICRDVVRHVRAHLDYVTQPCDVGHMTI